MLNRQNEDPDFLDSVEMAEDFRMSVVEDAKKKKIDEWYRPALEKELKSRRRNVYWDVSTVNQNNVNMEKDISTMTDEELAEFINKNS